MQTVTVHYQAWPHDYIRKSSIISDNYTHTTTTERFSTLLSFAHDVFFPQMIRSTTFKEVHDQPRVICCDASSVTHWEHLVGHRSPVLNTLTHTHTSRALWLKPSSSTDSFFSTLLCSYGHLAQKAKVRGESGDGDDTHFGKVPTRGRRKTTGFFASATRDISYQGTTASQCLPCRWDTSYWSPATGQHKPDGRGACRVISWEKNKKRKLIDTVFIRRSMKVSVEQNYLTSSPSSSIERHIVHFSSVSSSSSYMLIFRSRGLLCGSHAQILDTCFFFNPIAIYT